MHGMWKLFGKSFLHEPFLTVKLGCIGRAVTRYTVTKSMQTSCS